MGNFNKGKKFGGGRGGRKFDGHGRSNAGDRGGNRRPEHRGSGDRPQMHQAICNECGKSCEVPFRPKGDKPIFCDDCFGNKRTNDSRDFRDRGSKNFTERSSRPRFHDKQFSRNDTHKNTPNYKTQFQELNAKLDKILRVLIPHVAEEAQETKIPKSKKNVKKEVDHSALKKTIAKAVGTKKPATKKKVVKKVTTKKKTGKKKK